MFINNHLLLQIYRLQMCNSARHARKQTGTERTWDGDKWIENLNTLKCFYVVDETKWHDESQSATMTGK